MKIREETVAELVAEASMKMSDPNYSAVVVGGFVQQQTATSHYFSAHEAELGGPEAVVNLIFHAALLGECFKRANNRTVPAMSFEDLNRVAEGDARAELERVQPAILGFLDANVEQPAAKQLLMLVALAMEWVS